MKTIIEMAREAGAVFPADGSYHKFEFEGSLERFAALVRADERAQRTWVWLSEEEKQEWIDAMPYDIEPRHCMILLNVMEVQLKQRNT
jgi:hypothetical protein